MINKLQTKFLSRIVNRRVFSQLTNDGKCNRTFEEMISNRKTESRKSVIIQVLSSNSYPDLFTYCSQFGQINQSFYFENSLKFNQILLEYESERSANKAINSQSSQIKGNNLPALRSRFMYFGRPGKGKAIKQETSVPLEIVPSAQQDLKNLSSLLQNAESVSDQIQLLYEKTCLNDFAIRMRFIAAQQIEDFYKILFNEIEVLPFGSSVNGFGRLGSDLDLIMRTKSNPNPNNRLFVIPKGTFEDLRQKQQFEISLMGTFLSELISDISNVVPITKARIPIVKYDHNLLDLPVDISTSNMSGYYMSEYLYMLGQIDERVRPFVFAIRFWAKMSRLTGDAFIGMTNFPLTCLAICFLQRLEKPILPALDDLKAAARKSDVRITEDNVHYTFLRDQSKMDFKTENTDSLETLLEQFFEFIDKFNFNANSLSLNHTKNSRKLDSAPMFIENPFEIELNVSKAIRKREIERMKVIAGIALNALKKSTKSSNEPWGLLTFTDKL